MKKKKTKVILGFLYRDGKNVFVKKSKEQEITRLFV